MDKYLIIFILIAFIILGSFYTSFHELENFTVTGYLPEEKSEWVMRDTDRNIIDDNNNKENNNPDNSLTGFTYFRNNQDLNYLQNKETGLQGDPRKTNKLAPLVEKDIGFNTEFTDVKVEQNMLDTSTRIPNKESNNEYNLISNPSTSPKF